MFLTKWNRPPLAKGEIKGEFNSGETIVERAGYMPPKIQIEAMINAGRRLNEARAEQFDFPDGKIDDNFVDPTRDPNFDLADATRLSRTIKPVPKEPEPAPEKVVETEKAPE